MWKLQTNDPPASHITIADLAKTTRWPARTVAQLIRRIEERRPGKEYFVVTRLPAPNGQGGRPRNSYHLNIRVVVTFPASAVALLELATQGHGQFGIDRQEFEVFLCGKYGLDLMFLRERLAEAVRAGYIEVPSDGYIWPSAQIESEEPYLTLLAREFMMPVLKTAPPRTKRRA